MVWDPQKPKIDPVDPPVDPILAHFCGHFGPILGQKNAFFSKKLLQIIFYRFPDGLGPAKTENWPSIAPMHPIWAHFVGILGSLRLKMCFSQKNLLKIILVWVPDGLGPSNPQNWPFIPPNGPHLGVLWHFQSPCNPLGLAHKSSALFEP